MVLAILRTICILAVFENDSVFLLNISTFMSSVINYLSYDTLY
jgi:hypothetical protein